MFVLCPECKNHYDDAYQSKECDPNRTGHGSPNPFHAITGTQPVAEANAATKATRAAQRGR